MSASWKILFVVYVLRFENIRVISARVATLEERESYENQ
jgi:uncharacterized DUF497 family protein